MLRNRKQNREDVLLGRQVRQVALALFELAISRGPGGLSGHIHQIDDTLPDATVVERLASISSVIETMLPPNAANWPYKLWGIQLNDGSFAIQLGSHPHAAKLALPPAVSDYVRRGPRKLHAVA